MTNETGAPLAFLLPEDSLDRLNSMVHERGLTPDQVPDQWLLLAFMGAWDMLDGLLAILALQGRTDE